MKNDEVYLNHILQAIGKIEKYLKDIDSQALFKNNDIVIDAVVRELGIIGEAACNLSEKFKKDNPAIPLRDAIDMKNFLIHEYFGVNTKVIWDTYKDDLPKLKEQVEEYLEK